MQPYEAKLIDLIESKSDSIAKQWADDVMKHKRTPSYHSLPKEQVIEQGVLFYKLFRRMSLAENPFEEAKTFSWKYAKDLYRKKIPVQEALYALMLMRRNLWLYAEFQGTFFTALEKQQAIEVFNRAILMFDYISYQVTEKYHELTHIDVDRGLCAVEALIKRGCIGEEHNSCKYGLMTLLIVGALVMIYHYHSVAQTEVVFSHLFYIPIVLASIFWGKKGIIIAFILGLILLASHAIFLKGVPFTEDIIRATMFIVVGGVVGWLMENVKKVRDLFDSFKT